MSSNRGTIQVLSPDSCSTIHEDTVVRLRVTQDIGILTAYCAKADEVSADYTDSVVARVQPDGDGLASFVFPASQYPHGPATIRIQRGKSGGVAEQLQWSLTSVSTTT